MERLINRRQQGDLGEASAIEWFARQGATVSLPLGFSPDYDLVAGIGDEVLRVQVKTSTAWIRTPDGHERWMVHVATNGGNQSWTGVTKYFDPTTVDLLFALVGNGRRWLIPAREIEAGTNVRLGGPKYSEFEIAATDSIHELVYGPDPPASRIANGRGSAGAWRAGPACKAGALALSEFESHLPHPGCRHGAPTRFAPSKYERRLGKSGRARINQKRRVTLPQAALLEAGLRDGDLVRASAAGPGRVLLEKVGLPPWAEPS
jgi:hypothetical protein